MQICILYSGEFGKKVIGNLVNLSNFCTACGDLCDKCRIGRISFADMVYKIHKLPQDLPDFIEDPADLFPEIKHCDLIIALGIHPDLLSNIPAIAESISARAVIVPVEEPGWALPGLQKQIRDKLESIGIECEFPKPFCSLTLTGKPVIDKFVRFGFGRPKLKIFISEDGRIFTRVEVLRDAPCGSTWFVARKLKWSDMAAYKETISNAHHSYPCTASMDRDVQLEDTILHKGGYIIREAVEKELCRTLPDSAVAGKR